ncbi:oligopeptidase B [Aquimarina sp. MAR_2010_214]|uniref:prolyl oligopeptidase family serine peptidase n=1 Tax=Aquimarina sp. MAR_2010_214 TaxID=1250026 RepID=UPI000C7109BD|nr:prolyl oligopeptidase family serine peptidase [Aquimarina sp. MAR_2010_214]PKV52034.1 oligopeptidase B [Aquimarina sp. MAR_2010_214]
MKYISLKKYLILLVIPIISCSSQSQKQSNIVTDTYHGVKIEDEYRYLEDLKDSSVISWLQTQRKKALISLQNIPKRTHLIKLQEKLENQNTNEIKDIKVTNQDNYFYLKRSPNENYFKLYFRTDLNAKEKLLIDPGDFSKELGQDYYINYYKPSWDGNKLLISFTKNGEEFATMRIMDLSNNKLLPIEIKNCLPTYGGAYWLSDNSGITYLQVPIASNTNEAYLNTEVVLQKLDANTPEVLFSRAHDPELNMKPEDFPIVFKRSANTRFAISAVAGATPYHDYYYAPYSEIKNLHPSWKPLFKQENKITTYYQDQDSIIYLTSENASNFKICKTSLVNPNIQNPIVLVKEKEDEVIESFRLVKKGIVYTTTKNGVEAKLYLLKNNKNIEEISLPFTAGQVSLFSKGKDYDYLSITAEGWLHNAKRYIYDFSNQKFEAGDLSQSEASHLTKNIMVEELTVSSHDGTMVPLSLIYDKNLKRDGNNPVLMIGYGAYGSSITPSFSRKIMSWALEGGIFAVAHVRGGGEKGDAWYKGGFKETKPNTWKDLIACTEYLIKKKYTSAKKMTVNGGSAGGITVGRAMTERPDLFAAVIINVGKMNTIRSEVGFNGENNAKEFGTIKDSEEFKWLLEMDSYHHIKKGEAYPGTLIITGMNDSRVAPWHSAKFAAKLQKYNSSQNPILLDVKFESGHGSNDSKKERYEGVADILSFAFWQTGHPDYQPEK